ncbi:hypothetical protein GWZ55_00915 [Vibrio cholerae]|nr:hypothetical protein [Vibrio cholerae]EKK98015.1 metal binding domain of Ada family protein [Vibrio cholerae CP1035(8)]NOF72388.1 hypothetical protein [Vibrio cholerae]GHY99435.1 ada regulatory protein [Vibrio cholerae]HCJ6891367.1 hypothetical protein [Vibrio cholerae]
MTLLNELSAEVCQRARMSRDPRFDGRFFVAVKTTGIFCRPICPANLPKEENVEYFSSQALAVSAATDLVCAADLKALPIHGRGKEPKPHFYVP